MSLEPGSMFPYDSSSVTTGATLPLVKAVGPSGGERPPRRPPIAPVGLFIVAGLIVILVTLLVLHERGYSSLAARSTNRAEITATVAATRTYVATATPLPSNLTPVPTTKSGQPTVAPGHRPTPTVPVPSTATPVSAPSVTFTSFTIPNITLPSASLAQADDGSIWFVGQSTVTDTRLIRMTPQGALTAFSLLPPQGKGAYDVVRGPDSAIWFEESSAPVTNTTNSIAIGRITNTGTITEYQVPTISPHPSLGRIIIGPDQNLWFGVNGDQRIVRMTLQGKLTFFTLPNVAGPINPVVGPDGAIWVQEGNVLKMARITMAGQLTEYTLPSLDWYDLTTGSDGAIWFWSSKSVGRYALNGQTTLFPVPNIDPNYGMLIWGMTLGKDGNIWFTEISGNEYIGSIAPSGAFSFYSVPASMQMFRTVDVNDIITGIDGNLWCISIGANMIIKIGY